MTVEDNFYLLFTKVSNFNKKLDKPAPAPSNGQNIFEANSHGLVVTKELLKSHLKILL